MTDALQAAGPAGATATDLAVAASQPLRAVQRILLWLLKYHFAEDC